MSEAIYDPVAYTTLTDSIIHQILASTDPQLEEVQSLQSVGWGTSVHCLVCSLPVETAATKDREERTVQVHWSDTALPFNGGQEGKYMYCMHLFSGTLQTVLGAYLEAVYIIALHHPTMYMYIEA